MNLLIVPKPLFTSTMVVEGYFMAAQYGNAILEATKSNPLDRAMDSPFIDFMNTVGLDTLTQGKPVFIPITQIQLVTDLSRDITEDPKNIVFLLDDRVAPDKLSLERCEYFTKQGYRFAINYNGKVDNIRSFMPYIRYVFLRVPPAKMTESAVIVKKAFPVVTIIAMDIVEKPIFDQMVLSRDCKINLFDGPFYKVHIPSNAKQNALSPLKTNYLQLLNIVNQQDFDFQAFTRTVRQDTALAIQFMRLVNTASKSRTEIKNLNQAAAMLGQKEIKKWVSTAVANSLSVDSPSEITRLSLIRAKFCENLAKLFEMAIHAENLFLMGLFSVLDVVLDLPIDEAFKMIFVPDSISEALVKGTGDLYEIYHFIQEYEHAHWKEISRVALVRSIEITRIHEAYKEALLWYSALINIDVNNVNIEQV